MRRTFVLRVLTAYALCRIFSVVLLTIVSRYQAPVTWTGPHPDYFSMTVLWDGFWYRQIAEVGYPAALPIDAVTGAVHENAWAFYPAFPMMARGLMAVTGLAFPVAGSTLALVLGFGAAVVMGLLLRDRVGPKVALAAVAVFAALPVSPSLQIAYTESLALLLLCTALLLLRNRRYSWLIPVLVTLALTRAVALAFVPVLVVHGISRWRGRSVEPFPVPDRWRVVGLACLAVAVTGLWPTIAAITTRDPTAYTQTMSSWGGTTGKLRVLTEFPVFAWAQGGAVGLAGLICIIGLTAWLVLRSGARAWGPEVRAWAGFYPLYLLLATAPGSSNIRHLLLAFPLMWPFPEEATSASDRRARVAMAAILAVCGLVTQWVWISQFLVVTGPPGGRPFP